MNRVDKAHHVETAGGGGTAQDGRQREQVVVAEQG